MTKFITADEAAGLIPDHAVVGVSGMGLSGWAEEIACAIRDRFAQTGHPCGLDLKQAVSLGDFGYGNQFCGWEKSRLSEPDLKNGHRGITRLGEAGPGLITSWTTSYMGNAFSLCDLTRKNQMETYCLPQGVLVSLWRECAAGRPGLITKTGLGTFVDPRLEGGRMNACSKKEVVKLLNLDGEEYLFYPAFQCDIALLRGTIADEYGNISFAHESVINEGFEVAAAVKRHGGTVIVQVEYIAQGGSLNPKEVKIPGNLVDYVVLAKDPKSCWQTEGTYWNPSYSGQLKIPLSMIEPLPFDERKVICRRCAMELRKGNLINLGIGIPADIARVVAEEGCIDDVTISTDSGVVGGVPAPEPNFGSASNPDAILSTHEMADLISGGGLDVACLGIGEIDEAGNNNVSRMGTKLTGPGGFIDITARTKKVIFAGTLKGKARVRACNGNLEILEEGSIQKFVKQVEQITFSGSYSPEDQEVLYVTERAVFQLIDHKMTLIEIAPGLDLQKDVLDQIGFIPVISPDLKEMDAGIFREEWGELGRYVK